MSKYITWGRTFAVLMALLWGLMLYGAMQPYEPRNDSDGPNEPSHMDVFTDHLTGCQYLYRGSLTPRLDAYGKQICRH
jgi:hypothetical protein